MLEFLSPSLSFSEKETNKIRACFAIWYFRFCSTAKYFGQVSSTVTLHWSLPCEWIWYLKCHSYKWSFSAIPAPFIASQKWTNAQRENILKLGARVFLFYSPLFTRLQDLVRIKQVYLGLSIEVPQMGRFSSLVINSQGIHFPHPPRRQ